MMLFIFGKNIERLPAANKNKNKINLDGDIQMSSIYNNIDTSLYPKDTSYDKLVDIFTTQENKYYNCDQADNIGRFGKTDGKGDMLENWQRELNMVFRLISVPLYVFNRESIPVTRYFTETDKDNTLAPLAQSVVDVLNEKLNKTTIITDIRNIEVLTTEDQKQYTFILFLNYPTINKENYPVFKNIKVKVVLIRRRLIKDDIFAPNRYDTTKFAIKKMRLVDSKNIATIPKIKKGEENYYSFKKLMTESGKFTNSKYIDDEMIRNRKKHEHEMDFRNIIIEDDNYLNDYMVPEKYCY